MNEEPVIGIDLGTTNSEVAVFVDGRVETVEEDGSAILPSCVGLDPSGNLLVGVEARNQLVLYPDRTVRSVKRKMGTDAKLALGDRDSCAEKGRQSKERPLVSFMANVERCGHRFGLELFSRSPVGV